MSKKLTLEEQEIIKRNEIIQKLLRVKDKTKLTQLQLKELDNLNATLEQTEDSTFGYLTLIIEDRKYMISKDDGRYTKLYSFGTTQRPITITRNNKNKIGYYKFINSTNRLGWRLHHHSQIRNIFNDLYKGSKTINTFKEEQEKIKREQEKAVLKVRAKDLKARVETIGLIEFMGSVRYNRHIDIDDIVCLMTMDIRYKHMVDAMEKAIIQAEKEINNENKTL